MTETQTKTARTRLALGITNVGVWVVAATVVLYWHFSPGTSTPPGIAPLKFVGAVAVLQCLLDWVGGVVLMPDPALAGARFWRVWGRGVAAHSLLLGAIGTVSFWSHEFTGSFAPGVAFATAALFLFRHHILRLLSGARIQSVKTSHARFWSVDASDPAFTGDVCGVGARSKNLLPASWQTELSPELFAAVNFRRTWAAQNHMAARAFVIVLLWNLAGCWSGARLLDLAGRPTASALLLQGCWMTLWGFLSLLVLPSLSRSAVFGADRAAKIAGQQVGNWIQKYPGITGEDGNASGVCQRIFYPIPSTRERLAAPESAARGPLLGNVARANLFLSLATLTVLGRCVHCNVGRPELWVFPPVD
jgi:hypothetical protein